MAAGFWALCVGTSKNAWSPRHSPEGRHLTEEARGSEGGGAAHGRDRLGTKQDSEPRSSGPVASSLPPPGPLLQRRQTPCDGLRDLETSSFLSGIVVHGSLKRTEKCSLNSTSSLSVLEKLAQGNTSKESVKASYLEIFLAGSAVVTKIRQSPNVQQEGTSGEPRGWAMDGYKAVKATVKATRGKGTIERKKHTRPFL